MSQPKEGALSIAEYWARERAEMRRQIRRMDNQTRTRALLGLVDELAPGTIKRALAAALGRERPHMYEDAPAAMLQAGKAAGDAQA